jgi:hypothetical protein
MVLFSFHLFPGIFLKPLIRVPIMNKKLADRIKASTTLYQAFPSPMRLLKACVKSAIVFGNDTDPARDKDWGLHMMLNQVTQFRVYWAKVMGACVAFSSPEAQLPVGVLQQFTDLNIFISQIIDCQFYLEGHYRHRSFGEVLPSSLPVDFDEKEYFNKVMSLLQEADTLLDSWGELPPWYLDWD